MGSTSEGKTIAKDGRESVYYRAVSCRVHIMSTEIGDSSAGAGAAVRGELPLKVTEASRTGRTLVLAGTTQSGAQWSFSIGTHWSYVSARSVVAWDDETSVAEQELPRLVGQTIIALDGSEDLFDPTLVLDSGDRIRQLSFDDRPETWVFELKGAWSHVGPLPAQHRLWLQRTKASG